ncbi:hypothetical protein ABL78_1635 [Leptomonas seymouri]|uniref:C2H2-type domain-containing protein n=1 Tax=Leptomonas seymouri TaxID=5684 RepID=A0A0N1I8P6_LEPSE|nr:hypothetical protein ABL78_1635 [Leptomonas seymouri]|eukprot:KPI89302.1 hypothetical protein ABL78_1635 [Leptomonas seymouri]
MKAKALQRKQRAVAAQGEGSWRCTVCTTARAFDTELDLEQHKSSKHSGAVQFSPTLYARVHEQIEEPVSPTSGDALEAAVEAMTLHEDCYCSVCGLQYKTPAAYEEHLNYLSPLSGGVETCVTCNACEPPKHFTDWRGLEQHRSSKHRSA